MTKQTLLIVPCEHGWWSTFDVLVILNVGKPSWYIKIQNKIGKNTQSKHDV